MSAPAPFDLAFVAQKGRVGYEAALLVASLRAADPGFAGRVFAMEPQGPLWPEDPRIDPPVRALLTRLGAEIVPFENRLFGAAYPQGNKIEGLAALGTGRPFLFLDSDTLVTGPISALPVASHPPTASMSRTNTWPVPVEPYGAEAGEIWAALYDRFGLDRASSLDPAYPEGHWKRHLYFNAGWFTGPDPAAFGARFAEWAAAIRDDPPDALVNQPLDPWLDQIALPLVIHSLGGGRPGPGMAPLDGGVAWHWRAMPLAFATGSDAQIAALRRAAAPNRVKTVLKAHGPFLRFVFQGRGARARALFDGGALPRTEREVRGRLKRAGLWMR